ncbi:xanthine dehydrogenase family protein molybdopterin-binding subunit [Neobacillus sp. WH10]|uniref:xanthine dehydrogenase family protein molybdopterin-binding subunit n=1 Tax=Neobacillus sp. WH10 TaxID=3047873 RepID=UPI0024C16D8C|nr:xanthine dehydrogenase family protein molybdopterin-binding subunit [Neobacillus sp. WH10]WHY77116.1 xanthine dehydrogenase family protein molybdopterin-binding subunit [Neobacillus sp. WH10]
MTIGTSVKRIEDPRLIQGKGQYVGDIKLPGQYEAVIIRSPHAHANILRINIEKAKNHPEVFMVMTGQDLPEGLSPIPMRLAPNEALTKALQYPLAKDKVRYVGEPVVMIVAISRYVAEDAADLIDIVYEPLAAITDVHKSIQPETDLLHPEIGSNDLFIIHSKKGNIEEQLEKCPYVLEEDLYVQRHSGIPMETRGLLAVVGEDKRLTVYGPTKVVHFNHQILARLLKKDPKDIRFIETDVGGGFGPRGEFYPEDYLIPYAALQLGRPVKWIEDRLEHMKATNHSREQKHHVKVGFDGKGRIHALKDEIFVDTGAYIRTHGVTVPVLTQGMFAGPYDIEALEFITHVVATNKTPTGTYRGPGRFEGTFVRERIIDIVAKKLSLDPTVVRERNLIQPEQMPYSNGISALGQEVEYDSGDYPGILETARKAMDWEKFKHKKIQAAKEGKIIGMGFAMFVEKSGLGPWEFCEVEFLENGELICKTGLADIGQGVKTALAQICSEQLGIPYSKVSVIHGDTDVVEKGNGSFATRGTVVGGSAAWYASEALKRKIVKAASERFSLQADDLDIKDQWIINVSNQQNVCPLEDILTECRKQGVQLHEKYTFSIDHMSYPYGIHATEVAIDPETGKVKIEKYYIAYDVGRAINPLLVHGQLVGGMAQGLGGAIYEELKYDEAGQLVTGSFMDYLLPSSMEVPEIDIEILENSPSPLNPLGVKGAGEGGTVAVAPAVANAIINALDHYPIHITSLPIRPEQIRDAIKKGLVKNEEERI